MTGSSSSLPPSSVKPFALTSDDLPDTYALYRLPHEEICTFICQQSGTPSLLNSLSELNGKAGYAVVPFRPTSEQPALLIRPDSIETFTLPDVCAEDTPGIEELTADRAAYHNDFRRFITAIRSKVFSKLVLSRSETLRTSKAADPLTLFLRACWLYPRQFISLFHTPTSGAWLVASPEALLSRHGTRGHTMALAGTMLFGAEAGWSEKNRKEQQLVAEYIVDSLRPFSSDIQSDGAYTARAGELAHLRTDFYFTLPAANTLGNILDSLHPTPAICGLPKEEAREFIAHNEHIRRNYYAGFSGFLSPEAPADLYVSLRCMQLVSPTTFRLYAGGGLLSDSNEDDEWQETADKLQTMKRLFQ